MSRRKLTEAEKKRRKALFETVFINGKQKRVRKIQPDNMIDGYLIDDPVFLKEKEMWPELHEWEMRQDKID